MNVATTPTVKQKPVTPTTSFIQGAATTSDNPTFGGQKTTPTPSAIKNPPVDPQDQAFTTAARAAGLTDEQIAVGLMRKKQMMASGGYNSDGTASNSENDPTQQSQGGPSAAFGGRTKQEVLSLAFQSGIHDESSLKNIAGTYDLVTGTTDQTPEQKKQADYTKAQQFITDNPKASREDLAANIYKNTTLTSTDVNSLLDQTGAVKKTDVAPLTENNLQSIATELVKANSGLLSDSKKGLEAAQQQADAGKININGKQVQLSPDQIDKIKQYMQQEYPQGRTLIQKILPFGK